MDGHFVPNISFGPVIVQWLKPLCPIPLEVHLMISEPDRYLEAFAEAGADTMIVHQEGAMHLHRSVQAIHALGKRAGVAINPATPASVLEEILPDVELVLVMTVNPGFGGQKFIASTLPKIRRVRKMIDSRGRDQRSRGRRRDRAAHRASGGRGRCPRAGGRLGRLRGERRSSGGDGAAQGGGGNSRRDALIQMNLAREAHCNAQDSPSLLDRRADGFRLHVRRGPGCVSLSQQALGELPDLDHNGRHGGRDARRRSFTAACHRNSGRGTRSVVGCTCSCISALGSMRSISPYLFTTACLDLIYPHVAAVEQKTAMTDPTDNAVYGFAGGFGATTAPAHTIWEHWTGIDAAGDGFTLVNDFNITRSMSFELIGHALLALLFAYLGGLTARRFAKLGASAGFVVRQCSGVAGTLRVPSAEIAGFDGSCASRAQGRGAGSGGPFGRTARAYPPVASSGGRTTGRDTVSETVAILRRRCPS